jgi:excisionase family DNA binding protein
MKEKQEPVLRLAVSLEDACVMTALSIWTIRKAIKSGQLKVTRVGRRVLVPMRELERFVEAGARADAEG